MYLSPVAPHGHTSSISCFHPKKGWLQTAKLFNTTSHYRTTFPCRPSLFCHSKLWRKTETGLLSLAPEKRAINVVQACSSTARFSDFSF
jgi:hypothetical protein